MTCARSSAKRRVLEKCPSQDNQRLWSAVPWHRFLRRSLLRRQAAALRKTNRLEQRSPENKQSHREIDAQPGHVDECGDERRGARGGIESEFSQNERQHAA